jgi:hypothetical protein
MLTVLAMSGRIPLTVDTVLIKNPVLLRNLGDGLN